MLRLLLSLAFLPALLFAATVEGTVDFAGNAPAPRSVPVERDPVCSTVFPGGVATDQPVVVGPQGGLANVFVALVGGVDRSSVPAAPKSPLVLDQKNCRFLPRVVGVRAGQPVKVGNGDGTLHNVRAQAKKNPEFNVGLPPGGHVERTFAAVEMVQLHCHVHHWMTAWVGVVDHPYFAVSDELGRFQLADVPPGRYDVEAWHETLGTRRGTLVVPAKGKPAKLAFHFESSSGRAR